MYFKMQWFTNFKTRYTNKNVFVIFNCKTPEVVVLV